jgi:hypothetical protein
MKPTLLVILIKQLTQFNIEYLIVGGVAKILYKEKNYIYPDRLAVCLKERNQH